MACVRTFFLFQSPQPQAKAIDLRPGGTPRRSSSTSSSACDAAWSRGTGLAAAIPRLPGQLSEGTHVVFSQTLERSPLLASLVLLPLWLPAGWVGSNQVRGPRSGVFNSREIPSEK